LTSAVSVIVLIKTFICLAVAIVIQVVASLNSGGENAIVHIVTIIAVGDIANGC
jgi:hypothetical protein